MIPIPAIIDRLNTLLDLERMALLAYRKAEGEEYNDLLQRIAQISPDPALRLGLAPRNGPLDPFEQEIFRTVTEPPRKRQLYKVSAYRITESQFVYGGFVSAQNPPAGVFLLGNVIWIAASRKEPDGRVTAVHRRSVTDLRDEWRLVGGDPSISFPGSVPEAITRLLAPSGDEWSMEQYTSDL